jgi:hypothetical protein
VIYSVPLLSFGAFELATDQEWFGDIGARELAQELRLGTAWVIIAEAEGHGVLLIARSGRDRASMAHLHQVLRSDFIGRRRELLAKAEELASREPGEDGTVRTGRLAMRFLRGPYLVIVCVVAVAAGVALGWALLPRAQRAPDPAHYHQQAAINAEIEPTFRAMNGALRTALGPGAQWDGPAGSDERSFVVHRPDIGHGTTAFGSWMSAWRVGGLRYALRVSRDANTRTEFTLGIRHDGLTLGERERQTLLRLASDYGFSEADQARILATCGVTPPPGNPNRAVTVGGVTFTCTVLANRGTMEMQFRGPPPRAFAAPR